MVHKQMPSDRVAAATPDVEDRSSPGYQIGKSIEPQAFTLQVGTTGRVPSLGVALVYVDQAPISWFPGGVLTSV